jgi:hypothetical protein
VPGVEPKVTHDLWQLLQGQASHTPVLHYDPPVDAPEGEECVFLPFSLIVGCVGTRWNTVGARKVTLQTCDRRENAWNEGGTTSRAVERTAATWKIELGRVLGGRWHCKSKRVDRGWEARGRVRTAASVGVGRCRRRHREHAQEHAACHTKLDADPPWGVLGSAGAYMALLGVGISPSLHRLPQSSFAC